MTNALKGTVIAVVNSGLQLLVAFGVSISDAQNAAITGFANAVLVLWIALTYKNSPARKETG